ncbi:MAG: hypothetical protein WED33_02830 [Bacteroidia bacterium]
MKPQLLLLLFIVANLCSRTCFAQAYSISINAGVKEFDDFSPLPQQLEASESDERVLSYSIRLNKRVWENSKFEFDIGLQYSFWNRDASYPLNTLETSLIRQQNKYYSLGPAFTSRYKLLNESAGIRFTLSPSYIIFSKACIYLSDGIITNFNRQQRASNFALPLELSVYYSINVNSFQLCFGPMIQYSTFSIDKQFQFNPFIWGFQIDCVWEK